MAEVTTDSKGRVLLWGLLQCWHQSSPWCSKLYDKSLYKPSKYPGDKNLFIIHLCYWLHENSVTIEGSANSTFSHLQGTCQQGYELSVKSGFNSIYETRSFAIHPADLIRYNTKGGTSRLCDILLEPAEVSGRILHYSKSKRKDYTTKPLTSKKAWCYW